jgi:lipopolysaccharide transport system ATP-binding protein
MTKPAIEVRNLGNKFIINHRNKASYSTIKDDIGNIGRRLIGKDISNSEEEFWALKDVSFDVPQGEIFGVIGKNGSGKSTLLKTLSRIIAPTEGNIIMRGNVASLLDVGT